MTKRRSWTDADLAYIIKELEAGKTYTDLAHDFEVAPSTIRQRMTHWRRSMKEVPIRNNYPIGHITTRIDKYGKATQWQKTANGWKRIDARQIHYRIGAERIRINRGRRAIYTKTSAGWKFQKYIDPAPEKPVVTQAVRRNRGKKEAPVPARKMPPPFNPETHTMVYIKERRMWVERKRAS